MASKAPGYVNSLKLAAERGDVDALHELGLMHSLGQGVALDLVEAHCWFNLAAQAGHVEARACRAELALDMAEADIARAQRLARERRVLVAPKPVAPTEVVLSVAALTNDAPPRKQGTSGGVAERLKAAVC